jgi:ubiquinone/menaquinone biosynthesis C-methylase UbiE
MRLTNRWNRLIYRLWSPIYDAVISRFYARERRRAIDLLAAQPGERLLLVGVGTGADLPLLPPGVSGAGIDLSPDMLAHARARLPLAGREIALARGDAERLPLGAGVFDAAVLNLILSVVPDGVACLRETVRAVRPGGRIIIFDKFLPDQAHPTVGRRLFNQLTMLIDTDINRRLGDILAGSRCEVLRDEASMLNGAYRVILLQTPASGKRRRGSARS